MKTRRLISLKIFFLAFGFVLFGSWNLNSAPVRRVYFEIENEKTGKDIYTIRFLPGKTKKYEKLIFICTYHQEFPWERSDGKKFEKKIHEPVKFKYERKNETFIDDLDAYVNFRVPISFTMLTDIYGPIFKKDVPIIISNIKIKAIVDGDTEWEYDFVPKGQYVYDNDLDKFIPKKEPAK